MAKLSKEKNPFKNLWDRIEHYEKLDYMNHTFLDEILLLTEQLIDISKNKPVLPKSKDEYEIAKSLISHGKRTKSVRHAVKTYNNLYF